MLINKIEFTILENDISETGKSLLDYLAPDIGKVYVIAITRDGCPACEKQKPKLNELAKSISKKYGDKVVFTRIHVRQPVGSQEESSRSKDMLRHYFYPTNVIALRTKDRGSIEYYRNVSPEMEELKKNIEIAVEIATMIEKQTT
ncbi:MAG: thioredoxin family protein [Candidatus Bathyarchaeota archaeon]|nr:thioredoxin family protein [Candidatus Bathyarchaeota archaeon]MDH5595084.1 thioredoxin family protein [Candidatus Bathyarchaeota archaeon]